MIDSVGCVRRQPSRTLHSALVRHLPSLIYRLQHHNKRQVLLSTHSVDLLSDKGIDGREVLLLRSSKTGTEVTVADSLEEVRPLLEAGLSVADVVLSKTAPESMEQLERFQ